MAKIDPGKNNSKKDTITRTAATLFKTKGYTASSMRELAEAVGVEAPSLYNHIGSKSELLQILCFKVAAAFTKHLDNTEYTKGSTLDKIESIIRFHIKMMLNDFDEVYVANHEWKHLKEPHFSGFLDQRRNYEKRLVQLVQEGINSGELHNTDPRVAVLTILSAVRGLEFWQQHKRFIPAETLEQDMVNHLLNGITK